ncbi:hypothetical protein C8A03DRAFT_13636 [Achaetomium macrosporum]|uniref:Extracellular serine-rich protein n=1 Tax=Achaetomium macrosporum TaxID=79813 RepID=A0AAN7CDG2_9PEZI|nr:hypothetical protein C8A03DRAFT_13636 [Achaetomium macrosporum]
MSALQVLALSALLFVTATAEYSPTDTAMPAYTEMSTSTTAATSSSTASSTSSASSGPATVTIAVGAKGFVFTPNEAKANVSDIIRFNFYPGGHRVARAEFGWPCIPYEYSNIHKAGFYSGILSPQPPHYDVRVNDTEPIFFYCAAPGSCVDYQMIGVINPNATQTYEAQLEYAKNATYQLAPGQPFPTETPVPRPTPAPKQTPSQEYPGEPHHQGLSAGAIAGIAIGIAAVLILGAALIYLFGRRGGFEKASRKTFHRVESAAGATGGSSSPAMVEAQYASTGSADPTSPCHDNAAPLRSPYYAGGQSPYGFGTSPPPHRTTPSPGLRHERFSGGDYM